jgi:hypothetical protein
LERRLIDPEGYFQELRGLEKEVIYNPGLAMVNLSMDIMLKDPRSEISMLRRNYIIKLYRVSFLGASK